MSTKRKNTTKKIPHSNNNEIKDNKLEQIQIQQNDNNNNSTVKHPEKRTLWHAFLSVTYDKIKKTHPNANPGELNQLVSVAFADMKRIQRDKLQKEVNMEMKEQNQFVSDQEIQQEIDKRYVIWEKEQAKNYRQRQDEMIKSGKKRLRKNTNSGRKKRKEREQQAEERERMMLMMMDEQNRRSRPLPKKTSIKRPNNINKTNNNNNNNKVGGGNESEQEEDKEGNDVESENQNQYDENQEQNNSNDNIIIEEKQEKILLKSKSKPKSNKQNYEKPIIKSSSSFPLSSSLPSSSLQFSNPIDREFEPSARGFILFFQDRQRKQGKWTNNNNIEEEDNENSLADSILKQWIANPKLQKIYELEAQKIYQLYQQQIFQPLQKSKKRTIQGGCDCLPEEDDETETNV